jgi:hypothetical protein
MFYESLIKKITMKKLTTYFISMCVLAVISPACKNKGNADAQQLAKDIQSTTKAHTPGAVATSETGYYMKAKIDGKEWKAAFMIPDESASSSYKTIHGENGETYMNFMLWRRGIEPGKTTDFDDSHVANLSIAGTEGFWGGKKGIIKITTVDEQWTEGTFEFEATSSSSDKTIHVTEGSFRVPTPNNR